MNTLLEKALNLAIAAHNGQVDKVGKPYIFHPLRVAARCTTDTERIVALLHDTIEDSDMTAERLRAEGFPDEIVEAVEAVTHYETESYDAYIERAAAHPIGYQVKLHDLEDNMDLRRLPFVTEADLPRLNKYLKAYHYLLSK